MSQDKNKKKIYKIKLLSFVKLLMKFQILNLNYLKKYDIVSTLGVLRLVCWYFGVVIKFCIENYYFKIFKNWKSFDLYFST